jgi:16S rRNA (guanine966-N2)-methyltransferase
VLGPDAVRGALVLDLYAGTGALGIEALSRGARETHFLEGTRSVARALRENLAHLELTARAAVHEADLSRIELPEGLEGPYDLVFLDPPYEGDQGPRWLDHLGDLRWPEGGAIVVYERRKGGAAEPRDGLLLLTERTYSETTVSFYRAGSSGRGGRGGA